MDRIPQAIAAALLAGVLARFGLDAVNAVKTAPTLVLSMALAFLLGRRCLPRYAVLGVLLVGLAVAAVEGRMQWSSVVGEAALPVWTTPVFSWAAFVGIAVPLFVVTKASQNLPGVAAQRAAGYRIPVSTPVAMTGATTVLSAPFGGFAFNLAAITAAVGMGPQAHADPARRYTASLAAGGFYLAIGLVGVAVIGLLQAFPRELVLVVAGGLAAGLKDEPHRDAAGLTFLVTLSGVTLAGVGSAFWGVLAGALALLVQQWRK